MISDVLETFAPARPLVARPRFATRPVAVVAAVAGLLALWSSTMRPYQYDELYFLASGRHLAWGYADQPPLVPLLAHLAELVAPDTPVLFRLPAVLLYAAGVLATGAIAREFGGHRRAQVLAAVAYGGSLWLVQVSHWATTYSLDPHLWTIVLWLLVRAAGRPAQRRHWGLLVAGLVTLVDMQVKFLVPIVWATALAAALVVGPRWLVRRPELWAGLTLAALACVPTLLWQSANGWPYAQMQQVVAAESPRWTLVPVALLGYGVVTGMVMAVHGLCRLLRAPELATWRFLGIGVLGSVACLFVASGRSYYLAGFTGLLVAASAVGLEARRPPRWWGWAVSRPALAVSVLGCMLLLPLGPPGWNPLVALADAANVQPGVTSGAEAAYAALPPERRAHTALVAQNYPLASAVDVYTPYRAYSPHRGYWYFGRPPDGASSVLWVGDDPSRLRPWFDTVTALPTASGPPLWLAQGRRADWTTIWATWRQML
ncbi:MAG TPA: glycosyltransferase family 39 protein [Pseudonocardia sp.]|jgi:hypothetical protein